MPASQAPDPVAEAAETGDPCTGEPAETCAELVDIRADYDGDGRADRTWVESVAPGQGAAVADPDRIGADVRPVVVHVELASGVAASGQVAWAVGLEAPLTAFVSAYGDWDGEPGDEIWYLQDWGASARTYQAVAARGPQLVQLPSPAGPTETPLQPDRPPPAGLEGWTSFGSGSGSGSSGFGCASPGTVSTWSTRTVGGGYSGQYDWARSTYQWAGQAWKQLGAESGFEQDDDDHVPGTDNLNTITDVGPCFRWVQPEPGS